MTKQWELIDALRHTRHDWLNVIQLIKGNLALKRYDRIEQIIEEVTAQSLNESKLSVMDTPDVAAFLLTYNWECSKMKIDVDVIGEIQSLKANEDKLYRTCQTIINQMAELSSSSSENHLLITFLFTHNKEESGNHNNCQLTFDYQGILQMNKEEWHQILKSLELEVDVKVDLIEWNEHECVLQTTFTIN
ncbi:sporulation initiation phosphotransferase B [Alkalihalophilus marmarensis]|uniref:sporulation initiation phosphotransferase B n=1 Tax=Alkalihalophilus marmarensis TaxID=521377 RepID=UPI002DB7E2F4|nr:sporulation initiation phosphotransferase B [Alkalihalophilus marmarensis]MEC2072098.1 sporulation initiation phosphotransferase B [Alkalihalophilus marmarensis]